MIYPARLHIDEDAITAPEHCLMIVRHFRPDDAPALAALFHASVRQVGARDYSPAQVKAWSPAMPEPARFIERAEGRHMMVAVDTDGVPLGYGDLEPDGHIDHLYCRPDKIRTGIGAAIYAALEAAALEAAIRSLTVEASEGARGFFQQRAFSLDGRNDFVLNGTPIHNYRMTKRLHESLSHEVPAPPVSGSAACVLRPADGRQGD